MTLIPLLLVLWAAPPPIAAGTPNEPAGLNPADLPDRCSVATGKLRQLWSFPHGEGLPNAKPAPVMARSK